VTGAGIIASERARSRRRAGRPSPGRRLASGALLLALGAAAAGCASGTGQTSVYLAIYDSTPVSATTSVNLDVYGPADAGKLASLLRTAPPSASSGSQLLGTVVIFPDASATLGALHVEAQRLEQGVVVSQGSIDVRLDLDHQVGATLTLESSSGGADAGIADTGTPAADAGTPAADAGADSQPAPLLANGAACGAGTACLSGNCADGLCCDNVCNGPCQACNLAPSKGICSPVAAGTVCAASSCSGSSAEAPARTCDANGTCGAPPATRSCGAYRCFDGACLTSCFNSFNCATPATCASGTCK
jgi:hypothetical protein